MFIPILKFRQSEMRAIEKVVDMLSDEIVPLFEVFKDTHKIRYEIDDVTGEFKIKVSENGRKIRIKAVPNDSDINTLDLINDTINGKKAFIDFLRINENKYKNYDANIAAIGLKLRNFDYYKKRVMEVSNFSNFIPVISIQNAFNNNMKQMQNLYEELCKTNESVAVRVTVDCYEQYIPLLRVLRESDYILLDIEETNLKGLRYEIKDFIEKAFVAKLIILNSPRPRDFYNKDFEESGKTNLIRTDVIESFKELGFSGFGDYCGCKDVLPSSGVAIKGAALSLLYNFADNAFWVNTNKNTSLGVKGYNDIKPKVMAQKSYLDPDDSCLAYKILSNVNSGVYATWVEVCIVRYISQLYKNQSSWN